MDRATLARMIDHTLLRPEATDADVAALCAEASELDVAAVCVSPSRIPPRSALAPDVGLAVVIGFPSGAHTSGTKVAEARGAVEGGATELDMVLDLGLVRAHAWVAVGADVAAVRVAVPGDIVLKVIVESAALVGTELESCCAAAEDAGADYVKTSTGFHAAGGATLDAVARIAAAVDGRLGVKASGGIRDARAALAMLDAGATRLGCSATRAILDGLD